MTYVSMMIRRIGLELDGLRVRDISRRNPTVLGRNLSCKNSSAVSSPTRES